MSDLIQRGLEFLRDKLQTYVSRTVTYKGIRSGVEVSTTLKATVGSSELQKISSIGPDPNLESVSLESPTEVSRDYTVKISDLEAAALWPPVAGDFIDDDNDKTGSTYRYIVKALTGRAHWDYVQGSYRYLASVHSKFYDAVLTYWLDNFTDSDVALTSHFEEIAGGGYTAGTNTIAIEGGTKIHPQAASADAYFSPGNTSGVCQVDFSFAYDASDLSGKLSKIGAAVRYDNGTGDGIECFCQIGYNSAGTQTTKNLTIKETISGSVSIESSTLSQSLSLSSEYSLVIENQSSYVNASLVDANGIVLASVRKDTSTGNSRSDHQLLFQSSSSVSDGTKPYITKVEVRSYR